MARLNTTVHVYDEDGTAHAFGPGDKLPKKYADQVTAPGIWQDDDDADNPSTVTGPPAQTEPPAPAGPQTDGAGSKTGKPPVAGPGSGTEQWKAYALQIGISVPDDAKKADIVTLVTDHEAKAS